MNKTAYKTKSRTGLKRRHLENGPSEIPAKKMKRTKRKSVRTLTEYESSNAVYLPRTISDNSVIYVKTNPLTENIPLIDLTNSSQSILYDTLSSNSVKVIYKSQSFNEKSSCNKRPATAASSAVLKSRALPLKATKSASHVAILDIPPEFYDEDPDESEYAFRCLSNADLTEEEKKMLDFALDANKNATSDSVAEDLKYMLEIKMPIHDMCHLYGVNGEDSFDLPV